MVRTPNQRTDPAKSLWRHSVSLSVCLFALIVTIAMSGCGGSGNVGSSLMTVSSMSPSSVYTTGGQVVFAGTNFTPDVKVTFGGVAAQKVYFQSSTLITATTAAVTDPGVVDVVVSTATGGSVTLPKALTYTTPPPPVIPGQCS